jgi:hypothetical protein
MLGSKISNKYFTIWYFNCFGNSSLDIDNKRGVCMPTHIGLIMASYYGMVQFLFVLFFLSFSSVRFFLMIGMCFILCYNLKEIAIDIF